MESNKSKKIKTEHDAQWWAERRREYAEKNDILMGAYPDWEWCSPYDFYRIIFPEGFLEEKGVMLNWTEKGGGKPNAIAIQITNRTHKVKTKTGKEHDVHEIERYTLTDDLDGIEELVRISNEKNESIYCAPVSYFGKARLGGNARFCHGFAIDLDGVGPQQLKNLIKQIRNGYVPNLNKLASIPQPTALVNSGTGFHVYYIFDTPVPLQPKFIPFLQDLKHMLTEYIWRDTTSIYEDKQFQGIYQAFRMPGTVTKLNGKVRKEKAENSYEAVAFVHYVGERLDRKPYRCSLDYLMEYVGLRDKKDLQKLLELMKTAGKTPIERAKNLWPEWYQARIVEGKTMNGRWTCNRALYDWWLDQIKEKASDKHRYWCLNVLAAYATKCGVPYEELERDALDLVPYLESLTEREDNHFTEDEALAAISAYDDGVIHKLTVDRIERRSAIKMPRNKRNKQKQADHLEEARAVRDVRQLRNGTHWWDNGNRDGAPTKQKLVMDYVAKHPDANHSEIARALGISRPTVNKWLKVAAGEELPTPKPAKTEQKDPAVSQDEIRESLQELFSGAPSFSWSIPSSDVQTSPLAMALEPEGHDPAGGLSTSDSAGQ